MTTDAPAFTFAAATYPLGPGPRQVQLVVVDASGNRSSPDVKSVDVIGDVINPTAVLDGPDSIVEGHPLAVSGERSLDPGGVIRRYFWQLDAHPPVVTTEPTFVFTRPTYVLTPGMHVVGLQVMDSAGNLSSVDQHQVQVIADTAPTAVLTGPPTVPVGADLPMSGASSFDIVGQVVRSEWTLDAFPPVTSTDPSFTFTAAAYPLAAGLHQVSLVVVDDAGQRSSPDAFQVRVGDTIAPTAVLRGPASIAEGDDLPMDGTLALDPVGRIVGYEWSLEGFAMVSTEVSSFTFTHAVYPLPAGRHVVQLVVVDDSGNRSQPDTWAVDVTGDTTNPTAVITAPQTIVEGDDLALSGDRSLDVGGRIAGYEWTLDSFPVVATTDPTVTFRASDYPLAAGAHTAQLVVVDDSGNRSTPDQVQVTVTARADTAERVLRVEGLDTLPARFTVRGTAWYLQVPAGVTTPQLSSTPPCANAAECLFEPRLGSTVVLDVDPGGNLLTGPFVAGWVGCDAQANGRCYVTPSADRTVTVRVLRTRPVFAIGTTGGALFSSAAGPGVLAFAAARTAAGDLLGGGAVVATAAAQYACGAVSVVERSGTRTTLVTRYGIKAPSAAGAAPINGYACRIAVTDATSRSGRDQFTIQVTAPDGAAELAAAGPAAADRVGFAATVPMTRILIVEDDPTFRQRFADIVGAYPRFALVAAVGTCAEARAALTRGPLDVLLCDLGLPDGDGADVVREARRLHPSLDAMVVTVFGDDAHVMRSLEAGATGYLLKDSLPDDFIATIQLLRDGGSPIHPTIARRVLQRFNTVSRQPVEPAVTLSDREREVLQLVSKGYRVPEIAALLTISPHTVSSHIKNIYSKLEVSSRGEAVYEASRLRLI